MNSRPPASRPASPPARPVASELACLRLQWSVAARGRFKFAGSSKGQGGGQVCRQAGRDICKRAASWPARESIGALRIQPRSPVKLQCNNCNASITFKRAGQNLWIGSRRPARGAKGRRGEGAKGQIDEKFELEGRRRSANHEDRLLISRAASDTEARAQAHKIAGGAFS